ncbi:MAG: hypothetical protein QW244_01605 [Candidatus Pacearchaeota archaeon]
MTSSDMFKIYNQKDEWLCGFLVGKNIMHVYLYPKRNWKSNFKSNLLYEFGTVYNLIFEHLIAEGLAESMEKNYSFHKALFFGNRISFMEWIHTVEDILKGKKK